MIALLGVVDYVVIGLMLLVSASVGLFFRFTGGRQKTTQEFLMAGKNMSIGPVAFSLMATYMSAISVLGIPAETYLHGTQFFMWVVGMPVGGIFAGYGLLPVFYNLEVSTAYEYLERRFGKSTRTVSSLLFTLQMIFYMAVVLYAPSLALNAVTGLSTWASVISLAVVCTFYCSLGGLKAVLWTDVFQALLMYVTISAVVIKGSIDFGGFGKIFETASEGGRLIFFDTSPSMTKRYTLLNSLLSGILFSMHTFGTNQAQIQRMLSVGDLKRAQIALLWSMPMILVFVIFCFWDGVVIYSIFHDCDPLQQPGVNLSSADQMMPYAILKIFSETPGLPGLCIAGVFSASLSTVSSAVNSLTAVTMEDFIRPFCFCKRLTESWAAFLAKIIAIGYGGLCLLLTFIVANFRGVLEASNVMFGMVGGPIMGIYILGMFSTTANEPGTLIGLLVGFVINAWMGFGSYVAKVHVPTLPRSLAGCMANDTIFLPPHPNETAFIDTGIENIIDALSIKSEEEEYVLPVYKMSFIWFPLFGALAVVVVGYIASFIISIWKKFPVLDQQIFSPFVRKWYFSSSKASSQDIIYPEVEMRSKSLAEFSPPNNCYIISPASQS